MSQTRKNVSSTAGALGLAIVLAAGGCGNTDAWMLDPTVLGRWERTPTVVPILDRIAIIEGGEPGYVEYSEVTAEDIVPVVEDYRIGPGDVLDVTTWDVPNVGVPATWTRTVDSRGAVEIPQLGRVQISGMSVEEAKAAVEQAMLGLVREPLAAVVVAGQRQQMFNVVGGVREPGPYFIPPGMAEYRLLDALSASGWFSESVVEEIYVIRAIPLTDEVSGQPRRATIQPPEANEPPPSDPSKLIEELASPPGGGGSPSAYSALDEESLAALWASQPDAHPEDPPADPAIELTDQPTSAPPELPPGSLDDSAWMHINGEWVLVKKPAQPGGDQGLPEMPGDPLSGRAARELVTQRVIRIPVQPLTSGDSTKNIVIKAGDIVRVPISPSGQVYLGGAIARSGTYNMPVSGRLTVTQAVIAAGGLDPTAIPTRVDLRRKVGKNQQATVQLNLRAIAEATQPNIYLKPEDELIIGTSFWATPWAVARGGFRASYGFGFLLDRNFGNDIFGAPPVNRLGQ